MTWNIRTGGRDGADPSRLDRVVEVVAAHRPDVLALQELRDFHRDGRMTRVAAALGMRAYLARAWFGQSVAVLVRPSGRVLRVAPVRRPFHHAAQRVVVATDAGPLTVIGTHLQPYAGSRRLREAGWLAAASRMDGLGLLLGDLNTLDPWTGHDERVRRLPPAYRRRHLRSDGVTVDTRAVAALHRAGYVDLFRLVGAGPPATVPTAYGGVEFSDMRLDYLLATPAAARLARRCVVVRDAGTDRASDHYPVLAELDLTLTD
ncbi:endonuclease/exonuclease/phosphatase family protein [Micromonospora zhanjiangensis]|uniref:Endonuclease/exonuclease/phosphatase family protein n=1 Tax=Micromonospora zhanjiangensis TaxID=1522057 RepID=A0ABV8KTY2_9ACTN